MEINEIKQKVLNLLLFNNECFKKIEQEGIASDIVVEKDEDKFILSEMMAYNKKYNEPPSLVNIYKSIEAQDTNKASLFKARVSFLKNIKADATEFNFLLDNLKVFWAKNKLIEDLKESILSKEADFKTSEEVSNAISKLGANLTRINNKISKAAEGHYSFTTLDIDEKLEGIKNKDMSKIKRFKIGHDILDKETAGFTYGEVLLILGNINQGKSMVLANLAFHLWFNGANVLILTAEMQPSAFDERIFSRASAVPYSNIMNGKGFLTEEDIAAFDSLKKEAKTKTSHIVSKWLNDTDNVNTVEKYLDDLEKIHGFVPDVLLVDSFECLSPVKRYDDTWESMGRVVTEFKNFAENYRNKRGLFIVSSHQAKTETLKKPFKEIDITDVGKSKIVAEKADAALYMRTQDDLNRLNLKVIKARRFSKNVSYNMSIDFSRALIFNIENDTIEN